MVFVRLARSRRTFLSHDGCSIKFIRGDIFSSISFVMYFKIALFIAFAFDLASSHVYCPDELCDGSEIESPGFVAQYCNETSGAMVGRCCIANQTDAIVGLDLRSCNLTKFNISNVNESNVQIIDLEDNSLQFIRDEEFTGYTSLSIIYVPMYFDCPGGSIAWNYSFHSNSSNYTECRMQLDPCDYLNVSCTVNGYCLHTGPGLAKCLCKPEQYGYKCLIKGEFPSLVFAFSTVIPTILLSAFLWFYLRKNVITAHKNEN